MKSGYKAAQILFAVIIIPIIVIGCNKARTAHVSADDIAVTVIEARPAPPPGVWNGTVDTNWYDGESDDFVITTAEELAGLALLVNGGRQFKGKGDRHEGRPFRDRSVKYGGRNFKGKSVTLGANIMLNDTADWQSWAKSPPFNDLWEPIGSDSNRFHGVFDGNGFTVSGVYISDTGRLNCGLFGVIGDYGTIKGLGVAASFIRGKSGVGVLAGGNHGRIIGCYSIGETVGDTLVGGLVGSGGYSDNLQKRADGGVDRYSAGGNGTPDSLYVMDGGKPKAILADTLWYSGSANEFTINTAEELVGFAMLVNGGNNFFGKTIKLGADIMLNDTTRWRSWINKAPGSSWTPIGKVSDNAFKGTFDGGGFVVRGLYMNDSSRPYMNDAKNIGLGLFGWLDARGTIKKLGLANAIIRGREPIGGLVGENSGSVINCYSTAWVTGDKVTGGLVGVNDERGVVSGCYTAGEVIGIGKGKLGGLVGDNSGSISSSYSTALADDAGHSSYYGGLVGYNRGDKISGSYYNSLERGWGFSDNVGIGKTMAELKQKATYIGWDFDGSWGIKGTVNSGYPYLLGFAYKEEPAKPARGGARIDRKIWDGSVDMTWYTDSTNKSEYTIATASELAGFALLSPDLFLGKTVKLGANIMLNDTVNWQNWTNDPPVNKWAPIGIYTPFSGTFDGCGFVISGVYINNSEKNFQGLFSHIGGGMVKNLGVSASYIKGNDLVGGLAGAASRYSTSDADDILGINDCYYMGTVIGNTIVGGLVGGNTCMIRNTYSISAVTGDSGVGGLVGYNKSAKIFNSYSAAAVTGRSAVGGFVGINEHTKLISGCYYNKEASKISGIGTAHSDGEGMGRTALEMRDSATFTGWDFDEVWGIDRKINGGYPYLRGKRSGD